jgi:hypothetical protein
MADELALWSVSESTRLTTIAWGTVVPGSSADFVFRVKNSSAIYTASGVTIELSGTGALDHYLSLDGLNFAATVPLGDLPASAVSASVTLRRVTPSARAAGAGTCNLLLQATAWAPA